MPAFYAHYRFGCDVLKQLPEDIRSICTAHRGLFDIGLHGPDIYFFYHPVLPNKVNRIGHAAHKRSGRYFLQRAQKVIASARDKDAARAYFYGLLCHFTLDSICHPYIHTAMKEFNVTHAATETAFDRALLLKDGKDPQHFDPCGHFEVNTRNAAVITPFYTPEATVALTEKSISSMVFYGRVLFTPNKALRRAIDTGLYITFHHDAIADMMMTTQDVPSCKLCTEHLIELYGKALELAKTLFPAAQKLLQNEKVSCPELDRTFDGLISNFYQNARHAGAKTFCTAGILFPGFYPIAKAPVHESL